MNEMVNKRPLDSHSESRILIIDDEPANVRLLERLLAEVGLLHVTSTTDPREAPRLFLEFRPDLVLLDLVMPDVDGFTVLSQIGELIQAEDYLPILVLTADVTSRAKQKALVSGASDFLTKPFDLTEVTLRIFNLLRTRNLHLQVQKQNDALEETVAERTLALREALTELATKQRHTVQQQRLQALGLLASGVVHDFGNSLNIILGFTEFVLQTLQSSGEHLELVGPLQTAMTAGLDGAKIVSRLREFHRPSAEVETAQPIDLNVLVEQAVSLTEPRRKRQEKECHFPIRVQTQLGDLPPSTGDPTELRQLLTNSIFNAFDAMPGGGTITLRTCETEKGILLQVSDTGIGMSEEVRERCFEPFFTTKGEDGTGLGLAVVYGIIERHGGTIEVESEAGRGTTFNVLLPCREASFLDLRAMQPPQSLNVLIVDEQPMHSDLLVQYLEQDLHTVVRVESAPKALAKAAEEGFDLVIVNRVIAAMTGEEFVEALKPIRPNLRTIVFHGFSAENRAEQYREEKEGLSTPTTITELRQIIRRAME